MEIVYQDEMFTVKNSSNEFLESKINNFPDNLKKVDPFGGKIYHTTIEEFYAYRDKFNAVLNALKPESDEAFHITCLYYRPIESSTCSIDIRYKYSGEELGIMLLSNYKRKKDDAIKQIEDFISKNDELDYKQEEERNNLIYKYNLLQQYKDKMQSNVLIAQERFAKKLHEMFEFVKDLSFSEQIEYIEKHKNDDKRV
jgi:hypothetical protein